MALSLPQTRAAMPRSHLPVLAAALGAILSMVAAPAMAQGAHGDAATHSSEGHTPGMTHSSSTSSDARSPKLPTLAGQYAFATIAEIVRLLDADASTDWSRVDLEGLRQHLIDMDRVTLGARVRSETLPGGARFAVSSDHPEVLESIRRMSVAHVATFEHEPEGMPWRYTLEERPDGVALTVIADSPEAIERVRGLGFIGTLVAGSHHERHHLAIARGDSPHAH